MAGGAKLCKVFKLKLVGASALETKSLASKATPETPTSIRGLPP